MFSASKTAGASTGPANYIEDVFSTWLYTGTGATQTITNSIDTTTYGGLVWIKGRSGATGHRLTDTVRGVTKSLASNSTAAQATETTGLTAFGTTGFTIGADADYNTSAATYVGWTFRKQPKFFDIVTFVAGSSTNRTISHSLGSTPAFYVMKDVSGVSQWPAYHTSLGTNQYVALNKTDAITTSTGVWGTGPTSTTFSVDESGLCTSGNTYVVYLFASNAGGFGLTGTDNVISCGSFTTSSGVSGLVNIGYEPQWVLIKRTDSSVLGDWQIYDIMRGAVATNNAGTYDQPAQLLVPNTSAAEANTTGIGVYQQGFNFNNGTGTSTYIYIAIRRGPMKVPTVGTSMFSPITYVGADGAAQNISAGFPVDMDIIKIRNNGTRDPLNHARLMGGVMLQTNAAVAQASYTDNIVSFNNAQNVIGLPVTGGGTNEINGASSSTYIAWAFRRAPSYMDVVCYSGTGTNTTQTHNLGVAPELWIVKGRSGATAWQVGSTSLANTEYVVLNTTAAKATGTTRWNSTYPTSSVFSLGTATETNTSAATYVAYLFATCAGVSKVGSYTGNGTLTTINCGFTGGARFVLIKRTDSTGNWFVWDTSRGMVSGNDPSLAWNLATADNNANSVYTIATGFQLLASPSADVNTNAATYIFLAIA